MQELLNQAYGYLYGMWRYRWSALLIAWCVALLGWLFVFSMPNQYKASTVVYIDTTSVMKPLLKGLAPETSSYDELKIMSRILLSRENLLEVIRETDMDLEINGALAKQQLIEKLGKRIVLRGGSGGKKDNIYEISFQGASPDRAYKVVSNLLNTMIEDTLSTSRTDSVSAQKFLDNQIVEYEKRLTLAEKQLAEFKKANVGYMPDEKGNYYARLQRAQEAVENTRSSLRLAEQRSAELSKQLKGERPLLDSDSYQSPKITKLREYQQQLDSLLNLYTEQHPDVQSLRSIIADLQADESGANETLTKTTSDEIEFNPVYQEIKVELSKAGVEVEMLKIQLSDQQGYVEDLKKSIDVIPEVEARLARLNRDYEVTRERYLDLVERRESARLGQDIDQSVSEVTFRVIEAPIVPKVPVAPNRPLLLVGVLVAAMAAGLGWGFLRFMLQPTFTSTKQITEITGLPVLGSVGLYLSPFHKLKRQLQLATFSLAIVILALIFGSTLWYQDVATAMVGNYITWPGGI